MALTVKTFPSEGRGRGEESWAANPLLYAENRYTSLRVMSLDSHLGLVHILGSTDLSVDWRSWHGLVGNLGHPNRKTKRQTWQMCALLTPKIGSGESTGEVMQEAWCRVYESVFGKEKRGKFTPLLPLFMPQAWKE